jgi:ATP-dependent DNA helicase RecG
MTQRPTTIDTAERRFETALQLLRVAYKRGPVARREITAVIETVRYFRSHATGYEAENRLDLLIGRLANLPREIGAWRSDITSAATELKALRPLIVDVQPARQYGTNDRALRQTDQEKKRLRAAEKAKSDAIDARRAWSLDTPVTVLPQIADKVADTLARLSIETIGDLLRHVPREYLDYSNPQRIAEPLLESNHVVYRGVLQNLKTIYGRANPRVEARLRDAEGSMIDVTWFTPYVAKQLADGDEVVIRGTVKSDRFGLQLSPVEWFRTDSPEITTGYLLPIYPLTKGLTQKRMRVWTRTALDRARPAIADWIADVLPILEGHGLGTPLPLDQAYQYLHFPPDQLALERARNRMSFDSLLLLQIGLIQRKAEAKTHTSAAMTLPAEKEARFRHVLPFKLTGAQDRAIREIQRDMAKPVPMTRLLQGDVGAGKTVVAAMAAFAAYASRYQTAIMAPTEILAEQHYRSFERLFAALPEDIRPGVDLLTGSTRAKERKRIDADLRAGRTSILIGTHAIIEDHVTFQQLGLVVIDEQHRFGVRQRGTLMQKAGNITPHVLSMTATPIPKTLNHVVHGDLDVSIIDERPPGRVDIETLLYGSRDRAQAERLIRSEVGAGRQVFVICPLVKESNVDEADDERAIQRREAKAAETEHLRLQEEVFPDLRVGLIHGQMTSKKKDEAMSAFRDGHWDILVATSVIEVGIDVPNATVIMIEGAERFGLSQLHQLRGRVGRGEHKSYCLLISESSSAVSMERLQAMVATNDGFVLAQKDLELRGPGDFIGTRQSGLPEIDWVGRGFDNRLIARANQVAEAILAGSSETLAERYPRLAKQLTTFWATTESLDTTQA